MDKKTIFLTGATGNMGGATLHELMQRTDRLSIGPALLFSDPLIGQGIQRIDVQPLPRPMELGLITLRGIPLSRAARQLASMIVRHLRHSPPIA